MGGKKRRAGAIAANRRNLNNVRDTSLALGLLFATVFFAAIFPFEKNYIIIGAGSAFVFTVFAVIFYAVESGKNGK